MPARFEKGSDAAKAWAQKMREARMNKTKGGTVGDDPFGLSKGGKKISLKRQRSPTPVAPTPVAPPPTPRTPSPQIPDVKFKSIKPAPVSDKSKMDKKKPIAKKNDGNIVFGGYLQPGQVPISAGIDPTDDVPEYMQEPDGQVVSLEGEGMCNCVKCEMCGGKLKKSLTRGLAKIGTKLNPLSSALKNKDTRNLMIQSGEFTKDTALPAVTTAGMPLYYGAAGTAGMMLGGPMGSMAATKSADALYNQMVAKPGYDPRARQKSETVGLVSGEVGKLGAQKMKSGITGGSLSPIAQLALLMGVPVSILATTLTAAQIQHIYDMWRFRNQFMQQQNQIAPEPQQGEFKEEIPDDIEMGNGMRRKLKKKLIK